MMNINDCNACWEELKFGHEILSPPDPVGNFKNYTVKDI